MRLKILISAYACLPGEGSESGLGWDCVSEIGKHHEITLLTREGNRRGIESHLTDQPIPNLHVVYYELPKWTLSFRRGLCEFIYYSAWQYGAYIVARRIIQTRQIDVVHHITMRTYWVPSLLALLPTPFIFGPVGGGDATPLRLWLNYSIRGKLLDIVRNLMRGVFSMNPVARHAARRTRIALAATPASANKMRQLGFPNPLVLPSAGLSSAEVEWLTKLPTPNSEHFHVYTPARLLHWKGVDLGLRAFALLLRERPTAEYWIFGSGPELKRLEQLASNLGIAERVHFLGWTSRQNLLERLKAMNVLLLPSIHDSGGLAVVEAMAAGRTVVCLALGGPALTVTSDVGFAIQAQSVSKMILDLAGALIVLSRSHQLQLRLGKAARKRVRTSLTLTSFVDQVNHLYREAMQDSNSLPLQPNEISSESSKGFSLPTNLSRATRKV